MAKGPAKDGMPAGIKSEIYVMIRVTSTQRRTLANEFKLLMKMPKKALQEKLFECGYKSDLSTTNQMILVSMLLQEAYGVDAVDDFVAMMQFMK